MNRLIGSLAVLGFVAFTSSSADAAHRTTPVSQATVSSLVNAPISAGATQNLLAGGCGYRGYSQGYYRPSNHYSGYRGGYGYGGGYGGGYRVPSYGGNYYGRPAFGYPSVSYGRGYSRGGVGLYIGF